jgi:uncharacterized protein (DUF983 family)
MARRITRREDPEFDDGPTEEDVERFSDVTQKCPHCGTEIFDQAEVCWKCGMAVTQPVKRASQVWTILIIVILIVGMALWQLF